MSSYDVDLFVIGAGSGGVAASRRAAAGGARVALCEAVGVGGTCVLRGCVPKKLLMYGTQVRDELSDAREYGWEIPSAELSWPRLMAKKEQELRRLNGVYLQLLEKSGVRLVVGRGRLLDAHRVVVGEEQFSARHVLIATGGAPIRPDIPGAALGLTSDEALSLPTRPKRLLIVGAGYIGVELAGVFSGAGAEVTLLARGGEVLPRFDKELSRSLGEELRTRGMDVRFHSQVVALEAGPGGTRVATLAGGERLETDAVLFAVGRRPNTDGLGLEAAGITVDQAGAIPVDERFCTAAPSIYAVGDVTNRVNLTPVAIAEGRAVAEALFHQQTRRVAHENVPTAVFSQPPIGTVGLSEEAAQARFGEEGVVVYSAQFRPMRHTITGRATRVLMKVVVEKASQRVLGMHMIGADSPEIIQSLAVAMTCGVTKPQLDATLAVHPTLAEEFVLMREPRKHSAS